MAEDKKINCSFCFKSQDEVEKLIRSNVNICSECIMLCLELLLVGGTDIVISCKKEKKNYEETVISFDVKKDD